uniref:Uncharacterized protein LOC104239508 n=1 Tax=Nicotiana sylvestris TaxID=4096 RepID=A0A1U7XZQ0_NICSY|nr:PREDICTED: uncharacterized protein LOC104239508 [Nicotiana sylvestris]
MRKRRGKTRGFSIQKKRKNNPNGKLEVIIPPDRTVAVGPGASNFVTKLSVTIDQNAKHDVKTWKKVSDLAKERIVAHMLDAFEFQTRNTLGILSFIQVIIRIDIVVVGSMIILRNLLQRRNDCKTYQKMSLKLNGNSWWTISTLILSRE